MMDARKKAAEVESSLVPISKEISALEAKLSEQQQKNEGGNYIRRKGTVDS